MHPDHYVRKPPACRTYGCKSTKYRVDRWRQLHERAPFGPKPCRCGEYAGRTGAMPHRKGSGWCEHNPNISIDDRQRRWEEGARTRCAA